jgi:diaminopimelate epimerase
LVEAPQQAGIDFRYRIFNADGSEVAQCGNGARCFAHFVRSTGLSDKAILQVETASGVIVLYHEDHGIRVNMGLPRFAPEDIPLGCPPAKQYEAQIGDERIHFGAVSMGNPHAVILHDDLATAPVLTIGSALQEMPKLFPERVNVGFAQVIHREHIQLRVYERGAGETQACGTGACAAMVICRLYGLVEDKVRVSLPGGDLYIQWSGDAQQPVWMTGPAVTVFEGRLVL